MCTLSASLEEYRNIELYSKMTLRKSLPIAEKDRGPTSCSVSHVGDELHSKRSASPVTGSDVLLHHGCEHCISVEYFTWWTCDEYTMQQSAKRYEMCRLMDRGCSLQLG